VTNHIQELFTESDYGALGPLGAPDAPQAAGQAQPAGPSVVERLGFPSDTDPALLAEVLMATRAAPPSERADLLRRPGFLSRLFSQSAAEACYLNAILAITSSPLYAVMLNQLRAR
jgi:hypothetical protein